MTSRPLRFLLGSAVGALALAGVLAPAATAAPTYPVTPNAVTVPSGPITPGSPVTIEAGTFLADSDVTFKIDGPSSSLGTSRGAALVGAAESGDCDPGSTCVRVADSEGIASAEVTFTEAGSHTITATGTGADGEDLTVSSTVTVAADAGDDGGTGGNNDPDTGGLANTGSDLLTYGVIGLALIAVGVVVVMAVRRRTPSQPAA